MCEISSPSIFSAALDIFGLFVFNFSHSNKCVEVSHVILICLFLMTNSFKPLFIYLITIHLSSLRKNVFSNTLSIFNRVVCFLSLNFENSLFQNKSFVRNVC